MLTGHPLMYWSHGTWDNKETWEYTFHNSNLKKINGEAYFSWFLTITSPLASKRECKANSELVPPPGNALEQQKFRRFSTVGNNKRPCIRESSVSWKNPQILEPEIPVRESSLPRPLLPARQYLSAGGRGFPALATVSRPVWPCVCPGPGQRHPGVLGSLLGISSQC